MQTHIDLSSNLYLFQAHLIESLKEGILIVSKHLEPVYMNQKAREICQEINKKEHLYYLPNNLSKIAYQCINNKTSKGKTLVVDHKISEEKTLRIRASAFDNNISQSKLENHSYVIIFLEDRSKILQEELEIEKLKYGLTDRESQILELLLQTNTYQDIGESLQISLNTVKFHAKNIYSKKRSFFEHEKIICFEQI